MDALFVPAPEVRRIAEEMSGPHGLEPDWLNDAAKGFLPGADEHPRTVFESESLLVQVPSPSYLLAMKLHASRDERDLNDAAVLFNRLGYTSAQDCIDLLTATYPTGQLLPRHRYIAEDIAARAHARSDATGTKRRSFVRRTASMTGSTRYTTPGNAQPWHPRAAENPVRRAPATATAQGWLSSAPAPPGGSNPFRAGAGDPALRGRERHPADLCHLRGRVRFPVVHEAGVLQGDDFVEVRGALRVPQRLHHLRERRMRPEGIVRVPPSNRVAPVTVNWRRLIAASIRDVGRFRSIGLATGSPACSGR